MSGPVCLITGAGGDGIGGGLCRAVADAGFSVVVTDIDGYSARRRAKQLQERGYEAEAYVLDVTDEGQVVDTVAAVAERWDGIHGLVNSAGVGLVKPVADVTVEEWTRLLDTDLRGAWLCARAVIPRMAAAGGGSIVNIGSVQALGPHLGYGVYSAAKSGLVGLTRGIAGDYGHLGIRCNIVHPGLVDSEQSRRLIAGWAEPESWMTRYLNSKQMLPQAIHPEDIGAMVAFLLGPQAAAVTAAEFVVDGGSSAMAFDKDLPPS